GRLGRPARQLAALARAAGQRLGAARRPTGEVGRQDEHQVEGPPARPRLRHARRLGRAGLPADGRRHGPHRRPQGPAQAGPPLREEDQTAGDLPPVPRALLRPQDRQGTLAPRRQRSGPARGTPRLAQLRGGLAGHRRQAPVRLVQLVRRLLLRPVGQAAVEARPGAHADAAGLGRGATPALHGETLVVNRDPESGSFIVALDAATGKTRWKVARDEVTTWATPLVVPYKGRTQVIVPATKKIRSYDLADGKVIWECGGLTVNCIPSSVLFENNVICM